MLLIPLLNNISEMDSRNLDIAFICARFPGPDKRLIINSDLPSADLDILDDGKSVCCPSSSVLCTGKPQLSRETRPPWDDNLTTSKNPCIDRKSSGAEQNDSNTDGSREQEPRCPLDQIAGNRRK